MTDKGEETNVFVATDLRFTVTASACNAELVSATLNLETGGNLAIFNNGNASPHAKESATVTKGDYTEDGKTYTFEGFWWDVDAASKGHWEATATAVLVVNTDPPTDPPPTIEVGSNPLPGNNDAVKQIIDFKVVNDANGWILESGTDSYKVLITAKPQPPGDSAKHTIQVQAKAVTELGLLASQVSWYKKCKEETKFLGTGETFQWDLVAEESTASIIAFGNAPNAKDGKGPEGPIKNDKDTGKPKPEPQAGESTYKIQVDGGYADVEITPNPFYIGETATARLVLRKFDPTPSTLPQVETWYVVTPGLRIVEMPKGHNHEGASVALVGKTEGTATVRAKLKAPTGGSTSIQGQGGPQALQQLRAASEGQPLMAEGEGQGGGGTQDKKDPEGKAKVIRAPVILFLDNKNKEIDVTPWLETRPVLHVSNWVTNYWKPLAAERGSPEHQDEDPDNFRIKVDDPAEEGTKTKEVKATLEVMNGENVYTLQRVNPAGVFYGPFLRLVSDEVDNKETVTIGGKQVDVTILVKLGDTVKITYTSSRGQSATAEIKVGPMITVKVKVVVLPGSSVTDEEIKEDIRAATERLAQAGITLQRVRHCEGRLLFDPMRPGMNGLPRDPKTGRRVDTSQGFLSRAFNPIGWPPDPLRNPDVNPTDHERLIFPKYASRGVVTVYYVGAIARLMPGADDPIPGPGDPGHSYPASVTGNYCNNVLVRNQHKCYTLAHELTHILLNSGGHTKRKYHLHGDASDKSVTGTKRIGPYEGPGERYTADEEATMGKTAGNLPVPKLTSPGR